MRVSAVKIPQRRHRALRDVSELAKSIDELGLLNPITVTKDGTLIAGLHRLEAVRLLGWDEIPANEVDLDDVDRELAEIDENLIRNELTKLERGEQLHRRKQLYEAKYPETRSGGAPGKAGGGKVAKSDNLSSFAEDTATKTGQSKRTVEREVRIAERLPDELRDAIRNTDLADNQSALLGLAQIEDEEEQTVVAEMLVSNDARNVQQARRRYQESKRAETKAPENPECRIILGDCVHQVRELEARPACVVADPPYGLTTHNTRRGGQDYADGEDYVWPLLEKLCAALKEKLDPSAHLYFFSGYTHAARLKTLLQEHFEVQDNPIVWVKDNHTMCDFAKWYPSKHEYIWFAKMPDSLRRLAACVPDVLEVKRSRDSTHSAEKPPELLKRLIEQSTAPGELVLDPFCGSGSTGVAAKDLKRPFVGIESDQRWVDVARSRVAA